jgi:hypothetical protein
MKRFLIAHASALTLLLLAGASAHATLLTPDNVTWTYNFSPGAPAVLADGNPSAGVTFTNEPTKAATGNSDVVATNLRVFSTAPATSPDVLVSNGAYKFTLTLTNTSEGTGPATFTFTGKLGGAFSSESANVTNMFGANNIQSVDLGSFRFTVALVAYTPPGPPDQVQGGAISAHVRISSLQTASAPEPSTLLLSSLGLTFLGGAAWRRKRRLALAA